MNEAALRAAVDRCLAERLTFAAFRPPGGSVQLWAQRRSAVQHAEGLPAEGRTFVLAPFFLDPRRVPFLHGDVALTFDGDEVDLSVLDGCSGSEAKSIAASAPTTAVEYASWITAAKAAFAQGTLRKVVLSRTLDLPVPLGAVSGLFAGALAGEPKAFVALAFTPEHGLWLGASPEQLVHAANGRVRVDALAGTHPIATAPAAVKEWGEKERDEQQLVTDRVLALFAQLGLKNVISDGPHVRRAGPVAHLHTVIEADLGACPLSDLVLALHPTPAIGGTPTDAARDFIRMHETHDRQLYAGFWGPVQGSGTADLFVNIRCLRAESDHVRLFLGAGITAGSDPDREWAETLEKGKVWSEPIAPLKG